MDLKNPKYPRPFYFIVKDVATGNAVQQKDVQSFFRTGVNTGSDYLFTFVDIGSDERLSKYLAPKPGGDALYKDIEAKAPVFLVSDRAIKNVDDVRTITVHPIKNYTRDVQLIYNQMGFESPTTRLTAIRFLKRVNKYLHLKLNMFGLGVNLNDMISDLLDRMESHSP
jgi:hypothetical protein